MSKSEVVANLGINILIKMNFIKKWIQYLAVQTLLATTATVF